ncbi:uncharacterized protein LOC132893270 [Neoarius graeffei]|uniref:uncharacterized protein LOC132893270 n=1 Tax=Neoarius graeffei TaxID=443677 RepID=UPI00298C7F28|nr:uncharacterized protein LOC132893270 [Neoarius graeffei]
MKNCTFCNMLALYLAIYTALCYTSEETIMISLEVQSEFKTTATLKCPEIFDSNRYTSITWYKDSPDSEGIIRKSSRQGKLERYKNYMNRSDVSLTEEGFLVLENVDFSQAGTYKCYLAGKIGSKNNELFVRLNVTERVSKTTPALDVTSSFACASTGNSSIPHMVQPIDVRPFSVLVGFFSLSLSKVLLCFVSVWGVANFKKHQRRKWKVENGANQVGAKYS